MDMLQEGLAAAKSGDRARARSLLMSYVEQNPGSEAGWLWLAAVVETPEEAIACLERALLINPHSRRARAGLEWAQAQARRAETPVPKPPAPQPPAPAEPAPSGLLRRLGGETPPTSLRRASPYAPTRLFTEKDLARLPEAAPKPAPEEPPMRPAATRPALWDTPAAEPTTSAWEWPTEPVGVQQEEPLEPLPPLGDRLGAWAAPQPGVPGREPADQKAEEPALKPPPPLADRLRPAAPEAEMPMGAPPSLTDRLRPAAPPTWSATPEVEEAEGSEEPLGPPPSLADRLGTWATPSRPVEPTPEPQPVSDLSRRIGRLETSLKALGTPPPAAAPPPAPSLAERLRQLRGEPPVAPEKPPQPTETVAELMARGLAALESSRVAEAETAFRRVLELDPHHADAHANLAMVHYINKRPHEAIAELKIAVQRQPDHEDALYTLGVILNEVGRREEALQAWRQTLQINPAHVEAQRELEKITSVPAPAEPPADEAIHCPNCGGTIITAVSVCPHCDYELFIICPQCKEYVPTDSRLCPRCGYALKGVVAAGKEEGPRQEAEVHTRLGLAYLEDGRAADALREWQEASAIDPSYATPHFYRGLLFVEQQQVAPAIEAFQQALRLDPDYAEAYLELGLIYLAQNKRSLAQRAFEECLKHHPPSEVQREAQIHLERLG